MRNNSNRITYAEDRIVIRPYRAWRWIWICEAVCAALLLTVILSILFTEPSLQGRIVTRLVADILLFVSALMIAIAFLRNDVTVTIDADGVSSKGPITRKRLLWSEIRTFDVTVPLSLGKKSSTDRTLCFAVEPQEPDRKRTKGPCILVPLNQAEYEAFEREGRPRCERWRNA